MKGYDEYNTILLPPRDAGSELPKELVEAFHEMSKIQVQVGENDGTEKNANEEESGNQDATETEKKINGAAIEQDLGQDHEVGKPVLMVLLIKSNNLAIIDLHEVSMLELIFS